MSALSIGMYALDKSAAKKGGQRTPENTLHLLSLGGGWPGAMYAQQLLQGTQELNGHFLDLSQDVDFNKPSFLGGYTLELNKQVNNGIILFVQGDQYNTFKPEIANTKSLNFSTYNISFGIKFRP